MQRTLKKHADKLRFALVGSANTAIDFGVLFILVALGFDKIVANFFSTSTAFVFSFFANKSYTFQDKNKSTRRQFVAFLLVTLSGLWIIQPLVIIPLVELYASFGWASGVSLFVAKILATLVTLVWNYVLYKKFVFKKNPRD